MKKHFTSIVTVLIFLLLMSIPALANTSNWTIEKFEGHTLQGQKTHVMTEGTMTIAGSVYAAYALDGSLPDPRTITISVYQRKSWAADTKIGSATVTPTKNGNEVSFSQNLGSVDAGNYYLTCYKGDNDWWGIKGSGTLKTN